MHASSKINTQAIKDLRGWGVLSGRRTRQRAKKSRSDWHRCVSRCIAVWVNTEQAPPSPSSTHCTGVGEQLSSHPPTRESTHNHCVPRTPSLVCLIYRIMAAFVFTCCPFFNISEQERHPHLSCFKKYIPGRASPSFQMLLTAGDPHQNHKDEHRLLA